jgi:uncharacterized Fe-S cluster protein YjdI
MSEPVIKHYSNGEVTVTWQPAKCIHSTKCFHGLPEVFNPNERPWVNIEGASTEAIKQQVAACPSGALSYQMGDNAQSTPTTSQQTVAESTPVTLQVLPNGPGLVKGAITLQINGTEETKTQCALCRCGASQNKPFCDGSHVKVGFVG